MNIDEIRAARLDAQEEIRRVLSALADKTGFSVMGISVEVTQYHRLDALGPKYALGAVRIDLESI